ncbi:phage tail protein [Vagococcus fluvialis]|uniref:phage tail protein n=1 Tax=Vagococcus fluvialis TaxID=2738 RepID=UPI00378BC5DE
MLKFIDEKGIEHLVQAEIKASNGVNGERSISGEIHSNDIVIHAIGRGWKLEFENEFYCITYAYPDDDGKDVIVEFDAVHQFFYDFEKSVVYKELNGSNTFDAYLHFIFDGTDYSYRVETEVAAFEKQNFGMRNRLSLFNDVINSVGVEYVVSGKVVRIVEKVGTDLSTIVRKGFNLQDLKLEHNIGNFITYKKGYGAFIDPDDETKGRLEVEYRSPLADIYGELEGDPIIDERYTIKENLFERLKNEVDNSYSISVSLSMEDLTEAGYEQERPYAGDYIMAINEDVGFEEKVRIVSFTSSFDVDGGLLGHQVTCNSISMANRQSKGDKAWKSQVEANLEHAVTSAEYAAISADGKNMTFTGLFGPDGKGEPKATKTGDTWYKPNGEETDVYRWDGQAWVFLVSTKDNKIIQEKIEEVEGEVEKNKQTSEEALSEAEISREEARQAKQQAFNSEQLANSAKQDAITAIQKSDQNSTQITTLEGQQKLTNTKVEGNTANILNLQTDSEKLSLSIGKMETDLKGFDTSNILKNSKGDNLEGYSIWGYSTLEIMDDCIFVKNAGNNSVYGIQTNTLELVRGQTYTIQLEDGSYYNTRSLNYCFIVYSDGKTQMLDPIAIDGGSVELKPNIIRFIPQRDDKAARILIGVDTRIEVNANSTGFRLRKIRVANGTHTIKNWEPSYLDMTTKSEFATFEASTKGFQATVTNDLTGLKSEQTQMSNQITSMVKSVNINLLQNSRPDNSNGYSNWGKSSLKTVNEKLQVTLNSDIVSGGVGFTTPEIPVEKGVNYTIIADVENAENVTFDYCYFITVSNQQIASPTVKNGKLIIRATAWATNPKAKILFGFQYNSSKPKEFSFSKMAVFQGSQVYEWSPYTFASKSEVIQLSDQITQTVNKVETVDGKVTQQQSQITQLSNNINLKVDKDNAIAQINLSPESIRLDAKFIHLSGTSKIDDAIIKSAMIDSVIANKITTGTLNASNVNIINMNASNIVTGTISGANLRINLNTGEVLFNKGIIKKADDSFIMDLDKGYITNKDPSRLAYFLIKDGGIKFYDRSIFSSTGTPDEYGSLTSERQVYQYTSKKDGEIVIIQGKNGVTLQTKDFDRDAFYDTRLLWPNPTDTFKEVKGNYIHLDGGEDWQSYNKGNVQLHSGAETHITSGSYTGFDPHSTLDARAGMHLRTNEYSGGGSTSVNLVSNWYTRSGETVTNKKHSYLSLRSNGITALVASDSLQIRAGSDISLSSTVVNGNFRVTGTKNAIHKTSLGWVETPAYETAESYLGDIGTETTDSDGTAIIFIDKLFNETVNTKDYDYQVFLQSYSFGSNVFVTVRNEKYFIVKSDKPITSFAYEIKAKRKGYEKDRLNQYKLEEELQHVA